MNAATNERVCIFRVGCAPDANPAGRAEVQTSVLAWLTTRLSASARTPHDSNRNSTGTAGFGPESIGSGLVARLCRQTASCRTAKSQGIAGLGIRLSKIKGSMDRLAYIERHEAPECGNAQTVGCWPPHPRSNTGYGSVMTIQEETASMNWRIASDRSEPDTWTLTCLSNDNALRG